jgi:hypothetical protein
MDVFASLWADFGSAVDVVKKYVDGPVFQVLKWVLGVVALFYAARLLVPTWRILALSLYKDLRAPAATC